jgi:hypothetical protein
MKYVVAIPKSALLVVTLTLALFISIYSITMPWKTVFASPDTSTLRPNAAGTYQAWGTFGSPPSHWQGTSDQNDATGVQSPAGDTTAKETENLQDTSQTGTINSVTAYMRAKATNVIAAISYVGAGTAASGDNPATLTPTLPSGLQTNDLMLIYASARGGGTLGVSTSGWSQRWQLSHTSSGINKIALFYKFYSAGDGNPTVTYSGGSFGHTVIAQVSAFRGVNTTSPFDVQGATWSGSSGANIGPITGITTGSTGKCILVFGHRADDWTSVATLTGDSITWAEIGEPDSTSGNDAGEVWDYALCNPATTVTAKTFTVTGGSSQTRLGVMQSLNALNPDEQAVIVWRTHNADYESSAITVSRTSFTDYSQQNTTNPNTGSAWTWTEVNALEIGGRASTVGASEYIQASELWIVVDYTLPAGFNLNLRVRDWDLTDNIQGAIVYKDSDTQISDANGWANWTLVSGTVQIKVSYYGFWVNGTFSVTMNSDKTINVQCKLYDVTVLVQEGVQNAYLVSANVTVYNSTSVQGNKITSGVTGNNGQVQLLNLPNNTLTFTQYGGASYSLVIGNTTQLVSSENQTITLTANQNNINTNNNYSIIAFAGMTIPLKGAFAKRRLKKKRNRDMECEKKRAHKTSGKSHN